MPTLAAPGGVNPAPSVTINNTAYLFFVLFGAFIVFITIRGDLPKWLGLLGLAGSPTGATSTTPTTSTGIGNLPGTPALPSLGQSNAAFSTASNGVPSLASSNLTPVNTGYTGATQVEQGVWDQGASSGTTGGLPSYSTLGDNF